MAAQIVAGYRPGALGAITALHGAYYHRHWQFGLVFEAKVATEMAAFLGDFVAGRDGLWLALDGERVVGGVAIDGSAAATAGARLRWFIVAEAQQGRGLGRQLLAAALAFCRAAGYRHVYLTTFAGLDAARRLYEQAGFVLVHEARDTHWGTAVLEQTFAWRW